MKRFYDVAVIGSGLGGLLCAYILSKHGYKVAVAEQGKQLGGCLQVFRRKGYTFDTGMHYIGSLNEGEIMHTLFRYFGLMEKCRVKRLDEDGFDLVTFAGKTYPIAMGYEKFARKLIEFFPAEQVGIRAYISKIKEIALSSPIYDLRKLAQPFLLESEYTRQNVGDFIASFTNDVSLQEVLAGLNPLYAGVKEKTPVYIHAIIMHSYISSASRICGGSHTIVDSLVESIRSMGGEVFANQKITKIHCDDTRAVSIENSRGEQIFADNFISDIHPAMTLDLLDSHLIRNAYRRRIQTLENTVACFSLYIAFKPECVPYIDHNFFHYDGKSVWNNQNYTEENWPQQYIFMHHLHDTDDAYAQTAQAIAYMNFDDVKEWEKTSRGRRGQAYEDFKERKAQCLLNKLEEKFPGFRKTVAFYETSTPLTYRDYTGTKAGSIYGIQRDCRFFEQTVVLPRTKIPNLFLTGQNINTHGFLGVSMGAIITCAEILDIQNLINDIYS